MILKMEVLLECVVYGNISPRFFCLENTQRTVLPSPASPLALPKPCSHHTHSHIRICSKMSQPLYLLYSSVRIFYEKIIKAIYCQCGLMELVIVLR